MSRRTLLGGLAALVTVFVSANAAAAVRRSDPALDAELIRLCEAPPEIIWAAEQDSTVGDDCPLWQAYERSRDAIHAAVPLTLAGVMAKARAAKAEALNPNGSENPEGTPAETWAWDLVNDLLRLEAGA